MTIAEISNLTTNCLGTISFDMKAEGHRGFQNFDFCSNHPDSNKFTVQSDKRIGHYFADTGEFQLSKSRAGGSYFLHLSLDKLVWVKLSETMRVALNKALQSPAKATQSVVTLVN